MISKEQTGLINKAKESLRAARLLAKEDMIDFAVSRAYYTMFYIAEAFLLEKGFSYSKHSGVISAFGKHFAKTQQVPVKFHRYLIEAQDSRNVGDYDIGSSLDEADANREINRAEEFIALVEEFFGSADRTG